MNNVAGIDPELRAKLSRLYDEGRRLWQQFDREVRQREWHPFIPADFESVLQALIPLRDPGARFLEWGSGMGVITITADLLGFEAYGIEIDADLVDIARDLARRFESRARFAAGSFLPDGYAWVSPEGDPRLGTIGEAEAGYAELGLDLSAFDYVFGYPWTGEEPIMCDVIDRYGGPQTKLLVNGPAGVRVRERAPRP